MRGSGPADASYGNSASRMDYVNTHTVDMTEDWEPSRISHSITGADGPQKITDRRINRKFDIAEIRSIDHLAVVVNRQDNKTGLSG
jgi:hypothetical protein